MTVTSGCADERYGAARGALQAGEPILALEHISAARTLYLEEGDLLAALRTDLGRINVLDDLGRHREAVAVGTHLIAELGAVVDQAGDELHTWLLAAANENTGASHGCLGLHESAASYLATAEQAYTALDAKNDRARVLANLGVEHLELGQPTAALDHLLPAHAQLRKAGEADLARRCLVYAARATAQVGDVGGALSLLDRAELSPDGASSDIDDLRLAVARAEVFAVLHLWPEVLAETRELIRQTTASELRRDLAELLVLQARALSYTGAGEEASSTAREAVSVFAELGLDIRAAYATIALVEITEADGAVDDLEHAYRVLADVNERFAMAEAAMLGAERSNDASMVPTWLKRAADAGVSTYPELRWRYETLRGQLAQLEGDHRAAKLHYTEGLQTLRRVRASVRADEHKIPYMGARRSPLEALVALAVERGEINAARRLSSQERSWTLFDDEARPDSAPEVGTVLFQTIAGRLGAFVTVEPGHTIHVELDASVADVVAARREVLAHWRRIADPRMRVHLGRLREATDRVLQAHYLRFFEPIDRRLPDDVPVRLIPTASSAGLPFHAFHDGLSYLLERRDLRVLAHEGRARFDLAGDHRTLVIGVSDDAAPSIEAEARGIAEVSSATLLLNDVATVDQVREAIAEHDVVHIACHGRFRPENPQLSAIRLADRWLGAGEFADWDLRGKLVILAACSTGAQLPRGDDSALGLPRSLLAAGSAAVLMNLWPVEDDVSVGLMTQFHTHLRRCGPHQALRDAQLAAAANHPHPLMWAPTVVYGPELTTRVELSAERKLS